MDVLKGLGVLVLLAVAESASAQAGHVMPKAAKNDTAGVIDAMAHPMASTHMRMTPSRRR